MKKLVVGTGMGFENIPVAEQMERLAKIGWDGVFTGWNEKDGIGAWAEKARSLGLYYQSVHAPFDVAAVIWDEGEEGEKAVEKLIRCVEDCVQNGVMLVVMHTIIGFDRHTPNLIGIKRFGRIFDKAEELGAVIALENTEGEEYLEALMSVYAHYENVRFCIDTGHEMCYNHCRDLIGAYGKKLICTHLNDNMGITGEEITWKDDSHLLPFDGMADWNGIARRLQSVGYMGDLTFELTVKGKPERSCSDIYKGLNFEQFASRALERAKRFAKLL